MSPRATSRTGNLVRDWFVRSADAEPITYAELARRLSTALDREFTRSIVSKMAAGERQIAADEFIALVSILNAPLPEHVGRVFAARWAAGVLSRADAR